MLVIETIWFVYITLVFSAFMQFYDFPIKNKLILSATIIFVMLTLLLIVFFPLIMFFKVKNGNMKDKRFVQTYSDFWESLKTD
jgi:hypothetical protein